MANEHLFKVRLGKGLRYLEATEDKPSVAYVSVVEDLGHYEDGTWIDDGEKWYDAKAQGSWADALRDYRPGDTLLVYGATKDITTEHEGQTFQKTRLWVNSFGVHPLLNRVTLDRSPKATTTQGHTQQASQAQEQGPGAGQDPGDAEPEPAVADAAAGATEMPRSQEYQVELGVRARQLLEVGRLSHGTFESLGANLHEDPGQWRAAVDEVLTTGGFTTEPERYYLTSVVDEYAGTGPRLAWQQAETHSAYLATAAAAQRQVTVEPPPSPELSGHRM